MIPIEQAWETLLKKISPVVPEEKNLIEALWLYLAEDVMAPEDSPPFDTSAMDGFALRSEDTSSPPQTFPVLEEIFAGKVPSQKVGPRTASKIMTGAPLPQGADAVVKVEDTSGFQGNEVTVYREIKKGEAIRCRGENIQKGKVVMEQGTLLRPEEMAILASFGKAKVPVRRAPQVGIISTGDEIVDLQDPLQFGQIRNSNAYMLQALLQEMKIPCHFIGIARDTMESTSALVEKGLEKDFLILTGGASVGEKDCVKEILHQKGVTIHFQKINLKPGKPTLFGTWDSKVVFGLPGNPVSSLVTFLIFVRVALNRWMGAKNPFPKTWQACLKETIDRHPQTRYSPAFLSPGSPDLVELLPWKGSGDLIGLGKMNCFAILPGERDFQAGERIEVLPR